MKADLTNSVNATDVPVAGRPVRGADLSSDAGLPSQIAAASPWGDAVAGLCVAGLLLPEAVAYAGMAHLPSGHGLLAAIAGLAVYAVLGGSRFAIVAPTSSTAMLAMAAVWSMTPTAGYGAAYVQGVLALVLLSGLLLVVLALARQGQLSSYISRPVLRGFAFALAWSIVARQLPDAVGLVVPLAQSGDPFQVLVYTLAHCAQWHGPSVWIAAVATLLLWLLRRWPFVPASLLLLVVAIGAAFGMDLQHMGVREIGAVSAPQWQAGLPALPAYEWLRAGELAFGLVMLVFAESWGSMRTWALARGQTLDANRELLALGVANIVSALFQGMPVGAGFSATTANAAAGAVSKRAGLLALLVLILVVVLGLPALQMLPRPVLAVAVMAALWHALSPTPLRMAWRLRRDRILLITAILAVLLLGVLHGMLVAIGVSILAALRRFSQPVVHQLGALGESRNYVDLQTQHDARAVAGLLILRPEEPLFFGSAERVMAQVMRCVQAQPAVHTVIVSLEESADLDSTALECLLELNQALQAAGKVLMLARAKTTVRELLERSDPQHQGLARYMFWSVADAVAFATAQQVAS